MPRRHTRLTGGRGAGTAGSAASLHALDAFDLIQARDDDLALDLDAELAVVEDLTDHALTQACDMHRVPRQEGHGRGGPTALREDLRRDLAVHVGQPEVPALEPVGQPRVIDAEQVQDRRLQVVDGDRIRRRRCS